MAEQLRIDYDMANLKSEFLLRNLLLFWVDTDRQVYNVRPKYLENPLTEQRMEYDCLINDVLAIEFNGEQHERLTEKYKDPEALKNQKARDLMKQALSSQNGITLITVTAKDLSVQGIRKALPPGTPIHCVDIQGPYAKELERLCSSYRRYGERHARAQHQGGKSMPQEQQGKPAQQSQIDAFPAAASGGAQVSQM